MPLKGYSPSEASRVVGVAVRLLETWDRRGIVRASVRARGTGSSLGRRYTFLDLVRIRAVRELRDAGLHVPKLAKVAAALARMRPPRDLAVSRLIVSGGRVFLVEPDGPIDLPSGQASFAYTLDLRPLAAEVLAGTKREREIA